MDLRRTSNTHADFKALTQRLDAELSSRYGTLQKQYNAHNVIDLIETALIGYEEQKPIACGCFKVIADETIEIKRMFVLPESRRQGFSRMLLNALERWAHECGYTKAILETGKGQPEAIALYRQCGYEVIPNYGVYVGLENSLCMQKELKEP